MAFLVVYDACVLYAAPLRDLLLGLARAGIGRARWSEQILDECFANILVNRPDLKPEALLPTRELMNKAVPDCLVTGHESLIKELSLPDPDHRHVLAAAIRCNAQAIITLNPQDFPGARLARYDIEVMHPDDFVHDLLNLAPDAVAAVVAEQAGALKSPPRDVGELLYTLSAQGLSRSVAKLRELYGIEAPLP